MKKTPWMEFAVRKPRLKTEQAQYGFDLTQFRPDGFMHVLAGAGIHFEPKREDEEIHGRVYSKYYWTGPGVAIVTEHNPITGEGHSINFAGYMGVFGDDSRVREVVKLIKANAEHIKDQSPGRLDFIAHRKRNGARQEAIQIRPSTYRGKEGFSISGRPEGSGWPIKIFTKTREGAEKIRDLYKDASLTDEQRQEIVSQILLRGEAVIHEGRELIDIGQQVHTAGGRHGEIIDLASTFGDPNFVGIRWFDTNEEQDVPRTSLELDDSMLPDAISFIYKGESQKHEQKFQVGDRVKPDPSSGFETQVPAGVGGTIVDGPEDYGEGPLWEVEWDDDPETSREPEASLMHESLKHEHVLEVMPDESELAGRLIAASPMRIGLVEPSRNPPSRMVYYLDGSEEEMSNLIDKMYEAGIEPYTAEVTPMEESLKHEQVGQTIFQQIRGMDPMALPAWGATDFVSFDNPMQVDGQNIGERGGGLMFKVSGPRFTGKIIIGLNFMDLYDVVAGQVRVPDFKVIDIVNNVYFDQLIEVIDKLVG